MVTWLVDSGPIRTGLDLKPLLQEFRPRFVAMTGICAGYQKQVRLGDLIVVRAAYHYEEGKIIREAQGQTHHLLETRTTSPTDQILQYVRGFEGWKEPVAELKQRWFPHAPPPTCHVGAMASGMAVRSDNPFPWLREKYHRQTIALDMEAASFYGALRHTHALVVKGVCDFADMNKNDTYHAYAARISAVYLLAFIQTYVTEQVIQRETSLSATTLSFPSLFMVPYPRNVFFTDREPELRSLHASLASTHSATLASHQAISGLGGIGKTQLAVEYAYRYRQEYHAVLWARAETREELLSSYVALAGVLHLPEEDEQDQQQIVYALKQWLQTQKHWLLILDNADVTFIPEFLPPALGGHLLLTTRASALGGLAHRLEIETFSPEQGVLFLLRRAALLRPHDSLEQALASDREEALRITQDLGGLPLALDQAGAYIEETGTSLKTYRQLYQRSLMKLFQKRRGVIVDHPEPVTTTWTISFRHIEEQNPAAADVLRFCAFLAPDAIPEEVLVQGVPSLGSRLAKVARDPFVLEQAMETARAYSLLHRDATTQTLVMHQLVQAVLRESLTAKEARRWMQRVIQALNAAFPEVEFAHWSQCEQYIPHILMGLHWMEQGHEPVTETGELLNRAGSYLTQRGRYAQAEQQLQRALVLHEMQLGPEHLATATSLNHLAWLATNQGHYAKAEPLFQRALAIREYQLGPEHPDTATSLNNLAWLYKNQGQYGKRSPYFNAPWPFESTS